MNIRGSYFLDNQVSQDLYFNVQNGENEYRYHHLGRELIQSEADNKSFDLMYGLTHKLSKATIKYDLWLQNRKRNVIPSDIAAYNNEVQKDKNLRLNVKLEVPISERRFMKFSMHSLSEQVLYTTPSINSDGNVLTNGFILNYKDISLIDLDFYYDKIISKANFFNENKTVNRSFIAINKSYQFKSVNLFGKLAKDFNTGLDLPITYQFKISHQIRNSNAFLQFSKNNIIPTLNDLYWPQGGNPDLKPELNYKAILGFETSLNNRLVDSIGIDIYHYQLKDRIIWIPQQNGFYTPENISAVISKGIDFHGSFSWLKKKDILFQTKINGSYNHNRISKDRNANNIGKSLIYQPEFNVVVANSLIFGKWVGTLVTNYTSKRPYLTDNSKYLASFVLFDVSLNYKLIDNLILNMDIYNVLNTDYQYINNYSMPLKYFDFNIKYTL
jgi:iron complex outermembrane receptor protein